MRSFIGVCLVAFVDRQRYRFFSLLWWCCSVVFRLRWWADTKLTRCTQKTNEQRRNTALSTIQAGVPRESSLCVCEKQTFSFFLLFFRRL